MPQEISTRRENRLHAQKAVLADADGQKAMFKSARPGKTLSDYKTGKGGGAFRAHLLWQNAQSAAHVLERQYWRILSICANHVKIISTELALK
jgi:hypothetical protein